MASLHSPSSSLHPRAFSLIELLVVIGILMLLAGFVVLAFNSQVTGNRMREAARITQATFMGARDRAAHAREARGVRFIRDAQDPSLATGFVYIRPLDHLQYGLPLGGSPLQIENIDTDGVPGVDAPRLVRGFDVDWDLLTQDGQLSFPQRIKIPAGSAGHWYTFSDLQVAVAGPPKEITLRLASNCATVQKAPPFVIAMPRTDARASCEIEVGNDLLPNHEPVALPSGIVIDLDHCGRNDFSSGGLSLAARVPANQPIDILFSPQGSLAGSIAATGPIHLLLNDMRDASQNRDPIAPENVGDKLVMTIIPQTGLIQTYPIDSTDNFNRSSGTPGADGQADDLFRLAKLGSRANP